MVANSSAQVGRDGRPSGLIGEFGGGDDFVAAGAGASGAESSAGSGAVGAPLLGEVAGVAVGALVDGAVEPRPLRWQRDLWGAWLVASAVGGLAAGVGAEASGTSGG